MSLRLFKWSGSFGLHPPGPFLLFTFIYVPVVVGVSKKNLASFISIAFNPVQKKATSSEGVYDPRKIFNFCFIRRGHGHG